MSAEATPPPDDTAKLYYSIREVSELLDVKPHVLRYWESQFRTLRPKKSRAGNRMYRPKDVDQLREIQHLLHVLRYTIAGARQELQRRRRSEPEPELELEDGLSADLEAAPGAFRDEEWHRAAIALPEGSGSIRESRASMEVGEELELFPIHDPAAVDSGDGPGSTSSATPSSNAPPRTPVPNARTRSTAQNVSPEGVESVANLDRGRSTRPLDGASTRGDEQGLPPKGSRGVSAADLAPLRDEIRQLKEWLEAGIIGARNRG